MICNKCNIEMTEGTAILGGVQYGQVFIYKPLKELLPKFLKFLEPKIIGGHKNSLIIAYNCPTCKKVEFYTE